MVYKYLYQWMGKLLQLSEEFPKPSKVFSGALFATYFMASQNEGNMPISYISISVNYTFFVNLRLTCNMATWKQSLAYFMVLWAIMHFHYHMDYLVL